MGELEVYRSFQVQSLDSMLFATLDLVNIRVVSHASKTACSVVAEHVIFLSYRDAEASCGTTGELRRNFGSPYLDQSVRPATWATALFCLFCSSQLQFSGAVA